MHLWTVGMAEHMLVDASAWATAGTPDAREVFGCKEDPELRGLLQIVREECDACLVEAGLGLVHAKLVEPKPRLVEAEHTREEPF